MKKTQFKQKVSDKFVCFLAIGLGAIIVASGLAYDIYQNEPENVQKILENEGYHDVKVGGYILLCGHDNNVRREFEAMNNKNQHVKGTICGTTMFGGIHRFDSFFGPISIDNIEEPPKTVSPKM